jgi:ABC-type bacteriocin/lantibiotic exporter with double-glycine peptidase domain
MSWIAARLGRIRPVQAASSEVVRSNESLAGFVWRASGAHQFYVGLLAVAVALCNLAHIVLQRRFVDDAITQGDLKALLILGGVYLAIILTQGALK